MVTTGEIMDKTAALLNDAAKTLYTYTAQLPYLNMALDELQELFEENGLSATLNESAEIPTPSGVTVVSPLPVGLVEIQQMFERPSGTTYDWIPMTRVDFLPKNLTPINQIVFWSWQDQMVKIPATNANNDVKMDYIRKMFVPVSSTAGNEVIALINAKSFLQYRTAGLCSEFIGENSSRAESLNTMSALAIARALNINVKGTQVMAVRRRPFMNSYRRSGGFITR